MVEHNMRGRIATISQRYARANNPLVEGYDPSKPNSWITYLDANNLYGTAMLEPFPEGNFRFLSQDEISDFDLMNVPTHGDTGYIVECDLKYPKNSTNSTVTTPWRRNISPSRQTCLAISAANLKTKIGYPLKSSSPTYWTKPNTFVITEIKHGLILTEIYRIVSFDQKPWLKPLIDYRTERRKMARNEFESD